MNSPLGILVPMQEEVELLVSMVEQPEMMQWSSRSFYKGFLNGKRVVVAQSGIGKVASSFTASLLIQHFRVGAILVTGVAGGISDHIHVGDLAIATQAVQHEITVVAAESLVDVPGKHAQLHGQLKEAAACADGKLRDWRQQISG